LAGYKFKRQVPIDKYIVDFLCIYKKLIIELDGYHHVNLNAQDNFRTERLEALGFTVLRFWNDYVLDRTQEVLKTITECLNSPFQEPV
jgi:very-short-patch-repair endonuclease